MNIATAIEKLEAARSLKRRQQEKEARKLLYALYDEFEAENLSKKEDHIGNAIDILKEIEKKNKKKEIEEIKEIEGLEIFTDLYMTDLVDWLQKDVGRTALVNEAIEKYGFSDLSSALQIAQRLELEKATRAAIRVLISQ